MPSTNKNSPTSNRRASKAKATSSSSAPTRASASPSRTGTRRKVSARTLGEAQAEVLQSQSSRSPSLAWLGDGVNLRSIEAECKGYWDILTGRSPLPIDNGVLSLMETATAIHTRACELTALIQEGEEHNVIPKGSGLYKYRTGPLRALIAASERTLELGSRRVTVWSTEMEETRSMV